MDNLNSKIKEIALLAAQHLANKDLQAYNAMMKMAAILGFQANLHWYVDIIMQQREDIDRQLKQKYL